MTTSIRLLLVAGAALASALCLAPPLAQAEPAQDMQFRHQATGQCATTAGTFGQLRLAPCDSGDGRQQVSYDVGTRHIIDNSGFYCLGVLETSATELLFWDCADPEIDPSWLRWVRSDSTFYLAVDNQRYYLCAPGPDSFLRMDTTASAGCRWTVG